MFLAKTTATTTAKSIQQSIGSGGRLHTKKWKLIDSCVVKLNVCFSRSLYPALYCMNGADDNMLAPHSVWPNCDQQFHRMVDNKITLFSLIIGRHILFFSFFFFFWCGFFGLVGKAREQNEEGKGKEIGRKPPTFPKMSLRNIMVFGISGERKL